MANLTKFTPYSTFNPQKPHNMFTGIIDRIGTVAKTEHQGGALQCDIETGYYDLELGESVAVSGVCLTVAALTGATARFFASSETLDRTNLGRIGKDSRVNLERAARLSTRLSGHLVQGHVDGLATLRSLVAEGESYRLSIAIPAAFARYCVEKGSIALDGVSLTINTITATAEAATIGIMIIPHTYQHTALQDVCPGGLVNVEVDVIAKYVERLCQPLMKS